MLAPQNSIVILDELRSWAGNGVFVGINLRDFSASSREIDFFWGNVLGPAVFFQDLSLPVDLIGIAMD